MIPVTRLTNYKHTLTTAQTADKDGTLFAWTQSYLRAEGWNKGLADTLVEKSPPIIYLLELPLKKLKRIMGPEKTMNYVEASDVWEKRVGDLVEKIKQETALPPLIVTDFWKPLELADGSHRHEALRRCNYETYWVICMFEREESTSLLSRTNN